MKQFNISINVVLDMLDAVGYEMVIVPKAEGDTIAVSKKIVLNIQRR